MNGIFMLPFGGVLTLAKPWENLNCVGPHNVFNQKSNVEVRKIYITVIYLFICNLLYKLTNNNAS